MYVPGLRFLVWFGGECSSYVHTLGCFRVYNFQCNGASSGESSRGARPPPPFILGKKEEITEGRKVAG